MEAWLDNKKIVVSLSDAEVLALKDGQNQGMRSNLLMTDAKIELFPLSAVEEDHSAQDEWSIDRVEKAEAALVRAHFDSTGDLRMFVPYLKLTDRRIPGFVLKPDQVEVTEPSYAQELRRLIPADGVVVGFGGGIVFYKSVERPNRS